MKSAYDLAVGLEFNKAEDFYQFIIDSIDIHGQPKEAMKHYLSMELSSRSAFKNNWMPYFAPIKIQLKFYKYLTKHYEGERL
jgi:hypothetical protein